MAAEIQIDIPNYFICPISLDIMKDPVTLPTGITYDRDSIEKWLFSGEPDITGAAATATCPVTKQALVDPDITPNVILRRLIQSWCSQNSLQRVPTPKAPVTRSEIYRTLREAKVPEKQMECLKKIKAIASYSHSNRKAIESAPGAVEYLASLISSKTHEPDSKEAIDEAFTILFSLHLSETSIASLNNAAFVSSLVTHMKDGTFESRTHSISLLDQILELASETAHHPLLSGLKPEFFIETARILKDQISKKATKSAMKALINASSLGKNRIRAVESGTVPLLIELLIETQDKHICEMILTSLDLLCQCAEGRAELLRHGCGLAIVAKKILRVSRHGTERAIKILHSIAKFSPTREIFQEMLELQVAVKLGLVLEVDPASKTRLRSCEIMQIAMKAWRNSPGVCSSEPPFFV